MSSWVGNPGRPPYVIPCVSAGLKKNVKAKIGSHSFFPSYFSGYKSQNDEVYTDCNSILWVFNSYFFFEHRVRISWSPQRRSVYLFRVANNLVKLISIIPEGVTEFVDEQIKQGNVYHYFLSAAENEQNTNNKISETGSIFIP